MASRAKGEVKVREWKSGRGYALRFWAYGERRYLTLGSEREGWDMRRPKRSSKMSSPTCAAGPGCRRSDRRGAAAATAAAMRGRGCRSSAPSPHGLVAAREGQVSASTTKHGEWALGHLVPFFGEWALNEIDVEAVDEYRQFKVAESEARARAIERGRPKRNIHGQLLRPLSPGSINKTIGFLQWVLSIALEYRHVAENAAVGRRRRLRERRHCPGLPRHRRPDRGAA